MAHPQPGLSATHHAKEAQQVVSSQIKNPSFIPHSGPPIPPLLPLLLRSRN
jgi:hypothetical protein